MILEKSHLGAYCNRFRPSVGTIRKIDVRLARTRLRGAMEQGLGGASRASRHPMVALVSPPCVVKSWLVDNVTDFMDGRVMKQ